SAMPLMRNASRLNWISLGQACDDFMLTSTGTSLGLRYRPGRENVNASPAGKIKEFIPINPSVAMVSDAHEGSTAHSNLSHIPSKLEAIRKRNLSTHKIY